MLGRKPAAAPKQKIHGQLVRISHEERNTLVSMLLPYVVVIKQDVSVRVPGAVESAHNKLEDACKEAERLSEVYGALGSFTVVDLHL